MNIGSKSFLPILLVLIGCAPDHTKINSFKEAEASIGKNISIEGIVSRTHEATGIYFTKTDLLEENKLCILPIPFENYEHGDKVVIKGLLRNSDCGTTSICLNTCSDIELIVSKN